MAKLTAATRNKIPTSKFAFPAKRKYPIMDASHARNALARGSKDLSPADYTKLKARVAKAFPSISVGGK